MANQDQFIESEVASTLEKEVSLLKQKQELEFALSPQGREMQLIKARQEAEFALTPVGQELQRFQTNQRMGQLYAASTLVPEAYRNNVANCAIAIDMATRMNANALMVMQNLYIVHGTPSWSSKFLISTINTCGRFNPLKFRFEVNGKIGKHNYWENEWVNGQKKSVKKEFDGSKIDNIVCIAYTTPKDNKDEILESSPVDCRLAVQEGWWTKNQSKWPTMTRQMLMYRAAAFWQRTYAPEISMGFNTVEETQDTIEDVAYTELDASGNEMTLHHPSKETSRHRIAAMARQRVTNLTPETPSVPQEEANATPSTELKPAAPSKSSPIRPTGEVDEVGAMEMTDVDLSAMTDEEYQRLMNKLDRDADNSPEYNI